jgi:hypothetical protein
MCEKETERLGARAIWWIKSYTNCWRKSMRIGPRRLGKRACLYCHGKLHRADFDRKPRGGPQWVRRYSFCCAEEDCRRRRTPESVRFLGRRVYTGLAVVLITTVIHGLKPARVRRIRSIADRLAHVEALASMVVGTFCPQLLLENRPGQLHASGMRANTAFVVVVEL